MDLLPFSLLVGMFVGISFLLHDPLAILIFGIGTLLFSKGLKHHFDTVYA